MWVPAHARDSVLAPICPPSRGKRRQQEHTGERDEGRPTIRPLVVPVTPLGRSAGLLGNASCGHDGQTSSRGLHRWRARREGAGGRNALRAHIVRDGWVVRGDLLPCPLRSPHSPKVGLPLLFVRGSGCPVAHVAHLMDHRVIIVVWIIHIDVNVVRPTGGIIEEGPPQGCLMMGLVGFVTKGHH